MLSSLAEAYGFTGQPKWRRSATDVFSYLETFLKAPDGLYYASQDALPEGFRSGAGFFASMFAYVALNDAARRKAGVPAVDRSLQTDANARIVRALVQWYQHRQIRLILRRHAWLPMPCLSGVSMPGAGLLK